MLPIFQIGLVNSGSLPIAPTTAYANSLGTGDRTASITVTGSPTHDGGTFSNLVDGDFSQNTTGGIDLLGTGSTAINNGDYFRVQFSVKKYIDEWKIYFPTVTPSMGAWNIQGSDDASSWTTYGSFTWDTVTTQTVTLSGVSPYGHTYWQMVKNGAGSNWTNYWFTELEFKIADGAV